ncbi:MAG: M4 family metallopeptidase [Chitinophagales bacterium]|nr:M4 family metallopeptidase [Chitinophagales bacterium]
MKTYFSKLLMLAILLLTIHTNSVAQSYIPNYLLQTNDYITQNFETQDSSGWFLIRPGVNITDLNFLQNNKQHFGMGINDNFSIFKVTTDDFEFMRPEDKVTHERYIQTYNGIKVEFAEFFIHHKNGNLVSINCKVVEGLNTSTTPVLNESNALTIAINHLGNSIIYSWLDSNLENEAKILTGDSLATYYPTGELLFAKTGEQKDYSNSNFILAWKFRLQSEQAGIDKNVYINASNGSVIKTSENIHKDGIADLLYYGQRTIDTKHRGWPYSDNILLTNDGGRNIETKEPGNGNSFHLWNAYDDGDDTWPWSDRFVTTPHYCASQSWDYFKQSFNRDGCKGNGRNIQVWANMTGFGNANYSNIPGADRLKIGFLGNQCLATLDILGHEFAHGVTEFTADLEYERESGALNESFSDIFGFMIERFAQNGVTNDWNIGEDAIILRSMSFPPALGQPSIYQDNNLWANTNCGVPSEQNDWCGVHTNSGVQNYWFHLLSVGSTNPTFNNIQVTGIGEVNASRIAYYNLTNFLGCNSDYNDSRWGSINSAFNLFGGHCNNEITQTQNAWAAVGIGDVRSPLTLSGPSVIYHINGVPFGSMPKHYTASGGKTIFPFQYSWFSPAPWQFSISGTNSEVFSITSFNGNFNTSNIQVTDHCSSISKNVTFVDLGFAHEGPNQTNSLAKVFPNPVRDVLHIETNFDNVNDENNWVYSIIDMNGIYKYQQIFNNGNNPSEINVSNYVAGTYNLIIQKGANIQILRFAKM